MTPSLKQIEELTVCGHAIRMGWAGPKRSKFRVLIELDEPPAWPLNVVWDKTPIRLAILSKEEA